MSKNEENLLMYQMILSINGRIKNNNRTSESTVHQIDAARRIDAMNQIQETESTLDNPSKLAKRLF
jgi:hypothetical protein